MIRLSYVVSVLLLVAAGVLTLRCVFGWSQNGGRPAQLLLPGGAVARFVGTGGASLAEQEHVSPLLASAQTFALYLNPPEPPAPVRRSAAPEIPKADVPMIRPPTATPKFKVRGTSCCVGEPERSLALIWEPGAERAGRWVKEGTQVGHFTIHEIRPGSVVYLDDGQLREMTIDRETIHATAVAEDSKTDALGPRAAMNSDHPTQPRGRPRRPTSRSSFTVGSTRTSALD